MAQLTSLIICSLVACAMNERHERQARDGMNGRHDKLVAHAAATDMPREWRGYDRDDIEPLGTGNYGEVWLAHNSSSDQQVVVKFFFVLDGTGKKIFLNTSIAVSLGKFAEENLQEARSECQAPKDILQATNFPEPNYVADCFVDGVDDTERSYLVMELAGSKTLGEYMEGFAFANIAKRVSV